MTGDIQNYGEWQLEVLADPAGSDQAWCVTVRPLRSDRTDPPTEPSFYAATRNDAVIAARRYIESLRD